ncbi:MAG: GNAT family N-acetyltransferase [Verrucomicrobiales bacterium]
MSTTPLSPHAPSTPNIRVFVPPEMPAAFSEMTFPIYRKLLAGVQHPLLTPLALGATADGSPAGLALVGMPKGDAHGNPTLFSIFVAPPFRRQGIGTRLMESLHQEVARRGGSLIKTIYMAGKPLSDVFERILLKTGWDPPTPRMAAIKADLRQIRAADPPWLRERRMDPARFQIIPWEEVTEEQKTDLRRWHEQDNWIAEDLAPWKHEPGYDRATSCALLRDGRLVSWVINHHMPDGTTRFTCSFAHPRLQRLGVVLWLYKESVDRAECHGRRYGTWTVPLYHPAMHAFAHRWMKPCAVYCRETFGSQKSLAPWSDSRS